MSDEEIKIIPIPPWPEGLPPIPPEAKSLAEAYPVTVKLMTREEFRKRFPDDANLPEA